MQTTQQNNKRIAKNTLLLYFRMLLLMLVSLYTSRVTLAALGVEDYGIYNVVGGVVAMFSVLSSSLSSSISRFITFELGHGDKVRLRTVFSTSVNIQIGLSIIIMILAEIGGVWFLNYKMNIAPERLTAANWVLQCSILTFIVNLISVPYNAAIIAHEKMSAFAYISILEASLKLLVVYLLYITLYDRLIVYAILLCGVAITLRLIYGIYCKRHFEECSYHFIYDKCLLKEMTGFAGWNFIGSTAQILREQGVNIVINLFCGAAVNAARGIAYQVNTAIIGFANNFMTALNPQITKSYATGDNNYMFKLIFKGAKVSYFLLLLLSLPVIIETDIIMSIWLKEVPAHAVNFVRLVLILALSESVSFPLITAMLATGKIKKYQIIAGGLNMLNFPISYYALYVGCSPEISMVIAIIISQVVFVARLILLHGMIGLPILSFIKNVYIKVIGVTIIAMIIPIIFYIVLPTNIVDFIVVIMACIICTASTIFYVGCDVYERNLIKVQVRKTCNKLFLQNKV